MRRKKPKQPARYTQERAFALLDWLAQSIVIELDVYQAMRQRIESGDTVWFEAVAFFLEHDNQIPAAMHLADAEAYAEHRGWTFEWRHDPYGWREADKELSAEDFAALSDVVLVRLWGRDERRVAVILDSKSPIQEGHDVEANRAERRMAQAELAAEEMDREQADRA